jgi:KDO2-lipid IV(A) lauroyltransferase
MRRKWWAAPMNLIRAHTSRIDDPDTCTRIVRALLESGQVETALKILSKEETVLPYAVGNMVAAQFAVSPKARSIRDVRRRLEWFSELLMLLGKEPTESLLSAHIFSNALQPRYPWREKALDRCSLEELGEWVTWNGLEHLEAPRGKRQGVIAVHSHFATQRVASLLLAKMGIQTLSMEFEGRLKEFGVESAKSIEFLEMADKSGFHLKEVYLAQRALKKGAVVQTTGDGYHGDSNVEVDFLGRKRPFKTGFAELGVATSAPMFPIFTSLEPTGEIRIDVLPPLEAGSGESDRSSRVVSVIEQYASLLEDRWHRDPCNISSYEIKKFLAVYRKQG